MFRGILSGAIAAGPTIIIGTDGLGAEVFITNTGTRAVSCDVYCSIHEIVITLAEGISLAPNVPTSVSGSLSRMDIIQAYMSGEITPRRYAAIFEAYFEGELVDKLELPDALTFVEASVEGELSNAIIEVT